jgi:prepilin-type processing-associated H-X9-DG protein
MSRHQTERGTEGRLNDFDANGIYSSGSGEGMACIDYIGMSGPHPTVPNPRTMMPYGDNRGMLLNLDSGGPCGGTSPECSSKAIAARSILDGTSHTILVAECSGRGVADSNGDVAGGQDYSNLDGAWASTSNIGRVRINVDVPPNVSAINPPPEINWANEEMFSDHPNGVNVLMCDGSVHFLTEDTHYTVYYALATRDDGEILPDGILRD